MSSLYSRVSGGDPYYHSTQQCKELIMWEGVTNSVYPAYIRKRNLKPCPTCMGVDSIPSKPVKRTRVVKK